MMGEPLKAVAIAALVFAFICGPATAAQEDTDYDCAQSLATEAGHFRADESSAHWTLDIGEGLNIQLHLDWPSDSEQFALQGFEGWPFSQPLITITFPGFEGSSEWGKDGRPYRLATEVRVGDRADRQWTPVNTSHTLRWSVTKRLLAVEGDVVITLYSTEGRVLRTATMPRATLDAVEPTLQRLHAEALEKTKDREHLCEAKTVTHVPALRFD